MYEQRPNLGAKIATPEDVKEYLRGGGGGGDEKPPTLRQMLKNAFDDATLPTRAAANVILRPLMDEMPWAGDVIDRIMAGGLNGWVSARWVLRRYGPSQS